jgi:hypothetical protein
MESIPVVETHVPLDPRLQFGKRPVIVEVDMYESKFQKIEIGLHAVT